MTPKPITTQVYHVPHAPDRSRPVCLEWRVLGERAERWWFASQGEAEQAAAGLRQAPTRKPGRLGLGHA